MKLPLFYVRKRKRNKVYKLALKYAESEFQFHCDIPTKNFGLCSFIAHAHKETFRKFDGHIYNVLSFYPEIIDHKPPTAIPDGYWFSKTEKGLEKRKEILKAAIKATNKKEG